MKIPLVPIHIVTSKTLEEKLDAAFDSGVIEGRRYGQTQIRKLLSGNATGPVRIRGRKKKDK
jgi:hypothetical protein